MAQNRYYSSNAVETELTAGVAAGDAVIAVASTSGFPVSTPYSLILERDTANEEVVSVTAVAGLNLTVTRGEDGTSAKAHALGATVHHGVSARDFDEPQAHIADSTGVHGLGASSSVVGTTDTQTLTNKTLTKPAIGDFTDAQHSHSGATSGGLLAQANTHESPDTDASTSALHHTIGTGANQALSGSHAATTTGVHGVGAGAVVGTTLVQTLTNKTLTSPTVDSPTITSPTVTGTESHSGTENHSGQINANGGLVVASSANNNVLRTSVDKNKRIHWDVVNTTTDSSGYVTITHGAGFTPSGVIAIWLTSALGGGPGGIIGTGSYTATTFRTRFREVTSAIAVSIFYICFE